ncbi:hypothetical protein PVK64_11765 [Aliivibrio sp. S4TY2]|uniref:hypothetical protein n=1 Tax=unclassified Aliivibrio TaxID=2645654 RepID=UPI002377EAE1|nr:MULTISPECIES: hypothetical protein [unclassified Aliivibrio]MDD9156851.1 hypothetical protein [Aliivibrio sp. S4TY2]MDD9160337.1 hypothetical protein [Aliivibrio sp. S4TY1]MDD9164370.1 hypothetical protein [Aliivibrio sp. S4MY2]MDD9168760.1 hypothetical protein [Aliivibrio sp. S4MY4]MDD9184705.1 hypothetical protein [Aliivibrio sp. S4MY3]
MSSELKLIPIALFCAFLSIIGHFILSSLFSDANWLEYVAAIIPLSMIIIVYFAFKFAVKNDER